jgi:hypothetical protein
MIEQNKELTCYQCNKALELESGIKVGRQEECPHCYASLHCCKMCFFYDPTAYNECKEPTADRIVDKEKANFCDFFKIGSGGDGGQGKDKLFNAANSLFKD